MKVGVFLTKQILLNSLAVCFVCVDYGGFPQIHILNINLLYTDKG